VLIFSLNLHFPIKIALDTLGCAYYSEHNCPGAFYPLINDAIDHLLVTFAFIILLVSTAGCSRVAHQVSGRRPFWRTSIGRMSRENWGIGVVIRLLLKEWEQGLIPMPSEAARGHPGSYSIFRLRDRQRLRLESRHRLHALASVGLFWNTTSGFGVSLCLLVLTVSQIKYTPSKLSGVACSQWPRTVGGDPTFAR